MRAKFQLFEEQFKLPFGMLRGVCGAPWDPLDTLWDLGNVIKQKNHVFERVGQKNWVLVGVPGAPWGSRVGALWSLGDVLGLPSYFNRLRMPSPESPGDGPCASRIVDTVTN